MSPNPSVTLDVETAAAFRDWLFETGVENHAEPRIANPLAELAAAIESELHDNTEHVAISASTTAVPRTDHPTHVDDSPPQHELENSTRPADGIPLDADSNPSRGDDRLPDNAWHSPLNQQNAAQEDTPTAYGQSPPSTATPHTQGERNQISVRYHTAYECSVCGSLRELETSLQVCAFVDDCKACGAVDVRFTAVGIPKPIHK